MAYKAKIAAGQHSSMQIPQYHILEYWIVVKKMVILLQL